MTILANHEGILVLNGRTVSYSLSSRMQCLRLPPDYRVKDGSLPNVTFPLNRNWAGSIPVNRTNHPNDTLFFWAFEHKDGSLTSNATDEPWAIWLNGGYEKI